jgi:hypothetical protein
LQIPLCNKKSCKAIIVFSAGFHEDGPEGAKLEEELVKIVNAAGASLIGPNCIGVLTPTYSGVFTKPIPKLDFRGVDVISGSGATAVFILKHQCKSGLHSPHSTRLETVLNLELKISLNIWMRHTCTGKALQLNYFILKALLNRKTAQTLPFLN